MTPAEVREGETTAVEIVLRSIAISGKVTRGGSPMVGARIEFHVAMTRIGMNPMGPNALPPNAAITREDGSYDLVVSAAGKASVNLETPDRRGNLPAPPVDVPDADSFVADFSFSGTFIEGVVVDKETEQPIPGAYVGASLAEGTTAGRFAGAEGGMDGRFRLELDPGEYKLTVRAETYGSDTTTVSVGESGVNGLRLALSRGLTIKGRVVDAAGRPVGSVSVGGTSGEDAMASYGFARTLPDGTFEMIGLADKPYSLSVQAEGGLFAVASGVSPGAGPVTLTLRPGGRVHVTLVGADGAPVARTTVYVSRVQGTSVRRNVAMGTTNSAGTVELMVPAGSIELMAQDSGREAKTTVAVSSGGTSSAELVLRPR